MDQQIITYALGIVVLVVLAVSYIRHRRHEDDAGEKTESSVSIKQTMAEMREYFGLSSRDEEGSVAHAFDLAPVKMLSDMVAPKRGAKRIRSKGKKE